jgi:hypothetical protein
MKNNTAKKHTSKKSSEKDEKHPRDQRHSNNDNSHNQSNKRYFEKKPFVCRLCGQPNHKMKQCPDICKRMGCKPNHSRVKCWKLPNVIRNNAQIRRSIDEENTRVIAINDVLDDKEAQDLVDVMNNLPPTTEIEFHEARDIRGPQIIEEQPDQEEQDGLTQEDLERMLDEDPENPPTLAEAVERERIWYNFQYKMPYKWYEWKWLLKRFGWHKQCWGRIPFKLKTILDHLIAPIKGYQGYLSYLQGLRNDDEVMKFVNQVGNQSIVEKRFGDVAMYYWSSVEQSTLIIDNVANVYNWDITRQTDGGKKLHLPMHLNIPWKSIFKWFITAIGILLGCRYVTRKYKSVGTFGKRSMLPFLGEAWVYVEELLKCIPGMATVIDMVENWQYGRSSSWHRRSMEKPFFARLQDHLLVNRAVESENVTKYNMWIETGVHTPYEECIDYISNTRLCASQIPYVPDQVYTLPSDRKEAYYHAICYNVDYFFAPCRNFENMEASLYTRVLDIPNSFTTAPMMQQLCALCDRLFPVYDPSYDDEAWYNSLKGLQKRNIMKHRVLATQGMIFNRVPAGIKVDEILFGKVKRVPRFLCNLSGHWLDMTGPCFSQLSEELAHGFFSGDDYFTVNGVKLTWSFAHGFTNVLLDKWYNSHIYRPGLHIICMGDDMMAIDNRGKTRFIECDFSKYDRTQNSYLLSLFWKFLNNLQLFGMEELHRELYQCKLALPKFKNQPRPYDNKYRVMDDVQMRFTGENATCLANTITNFLITALALTSLDPHQIYIDCGVLPKLYYKERYTTFLKGVWLLGVDDLYHWTKLPSMLCKFGKTLADPLAIYDKKFTLSQRYCQTLWSQFKGYGSFTNNWFYREIEKEVMRLTEGRISDSVHYECRPWEIDITQVSADVSSDFQRFCFERYGFTDYDLEVILRVYRDIDHIPCVFHSKLVSHLGLMDYG